MDIEKICIFNCDSEDEGGNKQGTTQHIFVEYIKVLTNAIQVNYEKTDSIPRSIVCSDVISNIFVVMLKNGNSLDTITSTCIKAATLYTESLFLLQYCLSEIKLKQITDIKRFVYLKTIGSYEVTKAERDIYNDNDVFIMAKTMYIMKEVIQQLIQCTVTITGEDKETEVSQPKLLFLFLNIFEVLQNDGYEFVTLQTESLIQHICDIQADHACTTEEISALLIRHSIHCMLYNYIYDTIQDVDISISNFQELELEDILQHPLDHTDNVRMVDQKDLRDHSLYKESVAFLCSNEADVQC